MVEIRRRLYRVSEIVGVFVELFVCETSLIEN